MKTNGRINERNIGETKLDGGAKARKKRTAITAEEKNLAKQVLKRVVDAMEYDEVLSKKGRLHPEAVFTDGGRFTLLLSRYQFEKIIDLIEKL